MTPFQYNSLSFINMITDNLRDRYGEGFPILKELAQNADDAGASTVDFVVLDGIPDADNPLLRGPALVCVNDGWFRNKDAKGIVHMALSSKSDEAGTIGKFGLGQKAVFHLCEAFLFMASPGDEPEDSFYPRANIIDPWAEEGFGDRQFPEWNLFSTPDRIRMADALAGVIKDRWFILWVPLRQEGHKRGASRKAAIMQAIPDPERLAAETADEAAFAELLPFLANVRTVRSHRFDGGGLRLLMEVSVADGAVRLSRGAPASSRRLSGRITSGRRTKVEFAGVEEVTASKVLRDAMASRHWPVTYRRNEVTLEDEEVPDKSVPHAAVAVMRTKLGDRDGAMKAKWAVYLPIDDMERLHAADLGSAEYTLLLHGCFFVDAGRRHVHGFEEVLSPPLNGDENLRKAWNVTLRDEGTLALIPEALAVFCESVSPSLKETWALCRAMHASEIWRRRRGPITTRASFALKVRKSGASWGLIAPDEPLRPLPEPPDDAYSRPWDTIPALEKIKATLTYSSAPNLRQPDVEDRWTPSELALVLNGLPVASLTGKGRLNWLSDFLEGADPGGRSRETVGAFIIDAVRRAILEEGAQKITAVASTLSRLLRYADLERLVFLPKEAARPEVLEALARAEGKALALRDDMRPEGHLNHGLRETDGLHLLTCLDKIVRGRDEQVAEAAGLAAARVLRAMKDAGLSPHGSIAELKVIRVRDEAQGKPVAASWNDLRSALSAGTLFVQSPRGIQRALQATIPGAKVLTLQGASDDWTWIAPASAMAIPTCDVPAALDAVFKAPTLSRPGVRATLLRETASSGKTAWCNEKAMRYLLHGDPNRREDRAQLIRLEDEGLEPVAEAILQGSGEAWRLVPAALQVGNLPADLLDHLGVRSQTAKEFLRSYLRPDLVGTLNRIEISEAGRAAILEAVDEDREVWLRLPFHKLKDGPAFAPLEWPAFLESKWPVPSSMRTIVRIAAMSMSQSVLACQCRFLERWGPAAQVETALALPEPSIFAADILDALAKMGDAIPDALHAKLKATPWLPCGGKQAAPKDLLELPTPLMSATQAALGDLRRDAFAVRDDVDDGISSHSRFEWVVATFGNSREAALARLAEGLEAVGGLPGLPSGDHEVAQSAARLAEDDAEPIPLAGWQVWSASVAAFGQDMAVRHLAACLCAHPKRDEVVAAMRALAATAGKDARVLFRSFLVASLTEWRHVDVVPELLFPNGEGAWVPADEVALHAEGIELRHTLHRELISDATLVKLLADGPAGAGHQWITSADQPIDDLALAAASGVARLYFSEWTGKVPPETVGALISLLGDTPDWRALAGEFLKECGRTVDAVRAEFGAKAMSGVSLGSRRFAVRTLPAEKVTVTSVAGTPFSAPLRADVEHLFAGQGFRRSQRLPDGGYAGWVELRRVDLTRDRQTLTRVLRNSLHKVLQDVYGQFDAVIRSVDELWDTLAKGGQVDIRAARRRVEDSLEDRLDVLKLTGPASIMAAIAKVRDARKRAEEVGEGAIREARENDYRNARRALAALFTEDAEVQKTAVRAMRARMSGEFAYGPSRVPFELFQNSDDAAVELSEARPGCADHFSVELRISDGALTFVHFGRAINDTLGQPDDVARGYGADLEKMLLIAASDKAPDGKVTGRFGFGFKCVHLVTDRPHIHSKWLCCDIVGGLVPVDSANCEVEEMVIEYGQGVTPTVVHLPARADGKDMPTETAKDFILQMGLLPVFAKRIRSVRVVDGDGERLARWRPTSIPGCQAAEVGDFRLPDGTQGRGIRFLLGRADLFVRVEAGGVGSLPDEVPTVWCTAPTTERWKVGYAINGRFSVDVGRTQLASDAMDNTRLLVDAGERLGAALVELFDAMKANPVETSDAIGLGRNDKEGIRRFWRTAFERLSTAGCRQELVSLIHSGGGLGALCAARPTVPTGLPGRWATSVNAVSVSAVADGALREERVLAAVGQWPEASRWIGATVSHEIAARLTFLSIPVSKRLRLTDIVRSMIGESRRIYQEDASRLGEFLNDELDRGLCKAEAAELKAAIEGCLFLSSTGVWRPVKELWAGDRERSPDLAARCRFAPADRLLDSAYEGQGMDLFHLARSLSGFRGDVAMLAKWAREANTNQARQAVLSYLAGQHGHHLADELRNAMPAWISDEATLRTSGLLCHLDNSEVITLMERLFPRPMPPSPWVREPPPPASAERFFRNLFEWWETDGDVLTSQYQDAVYPGGLLPTGLDDPASPEGREGWFTLLAIGSFHTMGRVQDGQHRSFVQLCRQRGWWRTFVETPPDGRPAEWMDILDAFSKDQTDDQVFRMWMRSFIDLYRINRWLEPIATSILSIERRGTATAPSAILSPSADPALSLGGWHAPTFVRTLGIGHCFVVREAARLGALNGPHVFDHCWMPSGRVRRLLEVLGLVLDGDGKAVDHSRLIAAFMKEKMPGLDPTFGGSHDLPLQMITRSRHENKRATMLDGAVDVLDLGSDD